LCLVRGCSCKSGGKPPHSKRGEEIRREEGLGQRGTKGGRVGEGLTPEGVSYRIWGREEEWDASAGSDTAGDSDEVGDAV
jgi:hypothetical protein